MRAFCISRLCRLAIIAWKSFHSNSPMMVIKPIVNTDTEERIPAGDLLSGYFMRGLLESPSSRGHSSFAPSPIAPHVSSVPERSLTNTFQAMC